jgi:hypothetical protein
VWVAVFEEGEDVFAGALEGEEEHVFDHRLLAAHLFRKISDQFCIQVGELQRFATALMRYLTSRSVFQRFLPWRWASFILLAAPL